MAGSVLWSRWGPLDHSREESFPVAAWDLELTTFRPPDGRVREGEAELRTPPGGGNLCEIGGRKAEYSKSSRVPPEPKGGGPSCGLWGWGGQAWDPVISFPGSLESPPCSPPLTRMEVCGECSPAELGMK